MKPFIFMSMIFLHILDDFVLQGAGFLCDCKQRDWWKRNAPEPMYRCDYLIGLVWHAFSWSFMIMIPIAWTIGFELTKKFIFWFVFNWLCHMGVDHLKANAKKINLIVDQLLHVIQICLTFTFLITIEGVL